MTTTDANGIIRWESTDPVTPLEATLNAGMDSVSAAITSTNNGIIYFVANVTERSDLVSTFVPTATKPLYVHRGDAPAGYNLEVSIDGLTWTAVRQTDTKNAIVTANQTGVVGTLVDVTGLSATITVAAGQSVKISYAARSYSSIDNDVIQFVIREGATTLAEFPAPANSANRASTSNSHTGYVIVQPTAGAHTYKLSVQRVAGTGTTTIAGSTALRNTFTVENLGTI